MNKYKWIIVTFFILTLVVVFILVKNAGNFLVLNEKPEKSDVIIVLSGGGTERLLKAAELYMDGYAPFLIISNGTEDNLYEGAQKLGIPPDSIFLEVQAKSTTENAFFSAQLMKRYGFQSAIIVSSNYHMRRVKMNFNKAISDKGLDVIYCSVPGNDYDPEQWWDTKKNRKTTYVEYTKMVGNYLGLHGNEAKRMLKKILSI